MKNFKKYAAGALLLSWLVVGTTAARADLITFSTATLKTVPSDPFAFTNSGPTSTLQTRDPWGVHALGAPIPVTFQYAVPNSYGLALTNIDATLILSAAVSAPASSQVIPFVGTALNQPITNLTIYIAANTAVGGKVNLLTLSDSTGMISGLQGGTTASVTGDVGVGDSVNYSSDFLSLTDATQQNYGFSFAMITPSFDWDGSYLKTMTLSGANWTFSAAPEPATLALVGLAGLPLLWRRRHPRSASSMN